MYLSILQSHCKAYLTQREYKQFHEAYLHYEKNNIQEIQAQQL